MSKFNELTLQEMKESILEDGILDQEEVKAIAERFLDDGVIDREEANFLFELNDAVSDNENPETWDEFFITAITSHVLEDDGSTGALDQDEWDWLKEKVQGDGTVDALETSLLKNIQEQATETPSDFVEFVNAL